MKIFVIPSWYPPAGGQFFVDQTKWLMDYDIDATVLVVEEKSLKTISLKGFLKDLRYTYSDEFGIPTFRKKQLHVPKSYRLNTRIWINQMIRLGKIAIRREGKPDIIQVHSCLFGSVAASMLKKKYGIPYLITEHRGRFNENNKRKNINLLPWFNPFIADGLRNASGIITVSSKLKNRLEEIAQQKLNIVTIPNPVNENLFNIMDEVSPGDTKTNFISISAFMPVKALDILLKAFAAALQIQKDIHLHFAGDGEEFDSIVKLADKLKIKTHVSFHGFLNREQVRSRILQSDFLVLSSLTEGQPVSVSETLLCGKPVIVTDVVSEDDVPPNVGYIIETGSIDALKTAILKAHSEKTKFSAEKIRAFALSRFSKSVVIPKIIEVMKSIISNKQHIKLNRGIS